MTTISPEKIDSKHLAMTADIEQIMFRVRHENVETIVRTRQGAYRSLMQLLNDTIFLDDFGQCGGTGRCGTCLVEVEWADGVSHPKERNEESTLGNLCKSHPFMRLACQIDIDLRLQNARVRISQEELL